MSSHRYRQVQKPPPPKCKQCKIEKAIPGRPDGLGINCGTFKDRSSAKIEKDRAAKAKARG
jgi:hypothetical protein